MSKRMPCDGKNSRASESKARSRESLLEKLRNPRILRGQLVVKVRAHGRPRSEPAAWHVSLRFESIREAPLDRANSTVLVQDLEIRLN